MAAEQYEPHPRSISEFGPAYFQAPETVKPPKGKHLKLVGHTAVVSEGLEKPAETPVEYSPHPFSMDTTQEQDAERLREGQRWLREQEQAAMNAFHVRPPELEELAEGDMGKKVVEIGENVLTAPAFKSRLAEAKTATQVDFIDDKGGAAIIIKEKLTPDDTLVTFIDKTIDPDHNREIRITASANNPDAVDVVVAHVKGLESPITISDPVKKARFVAKVLGDAAELVERADATDSLQAAKLARKDLNVAAGPAFRPDEVDHPSLRAYS